MAKSLRRKWKKKMRAETRKNNVLKELTQLKKMLAFSDSRDVSMKSLKDAVSVVPPKIKGTADADMKSVNDCGTHVKMYIKRNKMTMLDQNGQNHIWMSQRQRKKLKEKQKK
ncbi:protein LLP homolog [Protopterus annectens]|uniref:protein LLP homolog n=1 Tax=Protopterus annectens TaxID=7888 RepID=UPI001CFA82F2|nr:protein LLP homolog [Protopterus annectens]